MLDRLGETAGVDPAQDRYYTGYIAAVNDFLQMELVEETKEVD